MSIVRVYARKRASEVEKSLPNINRCLIKKTPQRAFKRAYTMVYRRTIPRAVRGRGNVRFSLSSVPLYEGSI